jgi:hypothetical protein
MLSVQLQHKLNTLLSMRATDRSLVYEAILALALARIIVITMPFRFLVPWLSRSPETSSCDGELLLRVKRAVTMAARNVPWNAVCLPQAMAAKVMLARRGCGSALHLGAGANKHGKLVAHAWLVAGGVIVIGEAGTSNVIPLARFG